MPNGRTLALGTSLLVALAATGGLLLPMLQDPAVAPADVEATEPTPRSEHLAEEATLQGRGRLPALERAPLATLIADLRSPGGDAYRGARREVRRRAQQDPALVQRLAARLEDPDRHLALRALVAIGRPAAVAIAEAALRSTWTWRRSQRIAILIRMGPEAAPAVDLLLARLPTVEDEDLRQVLIEVLEAVGPAARQAVPTLTRLLTPPLDDDLVGAAARALVSIDGENAATLGVLRGVLFDEDTLARPGVLGALARMEGAATPLLPLLIELLEDPEAATRFAAARTLAAVGGGTPRVVDALTTMLAHDNWKGQRVAASALTTLGPVGVQALIGAALRAEDFHLRLVAVGVLKDVEGHVDACSRILLSVLEEECDKGWKQRALAYLASLDPPPTHEAVLPAVLVALEDPTLAKQADRALANVRRAP